MYSLKSKLTIYVYKVIFKFFKIDLFSKMKTGKFIINFFSRNYYHSYIIGANDLISFDDIEDVINRSQKCVLVEPHPDYSAILKYKYKDLEKYNIVSKAIHQIKSQMRLYSVVNLNKYDAWTKGISSFNELHLKSNGINQNDIQVHNVECISIEKLLSSFSSAKDPIYLQIDVEGYDYEVVKYIDFKIHNIRFIKIEFVNLTTTEFLSLKRVLKSNNFIYFTKENDLYAVR